MNLVEVVVGIIALVAVWFEWNRDFGSAESGEVEADLNG